jgi:protein TonB
MKIHLMNIYSKPLQLSLFFHGIILFILMNQNMSPVKTQDILVIDFSMGNEPLFRESAPTDSVSHPVKLQRSITSTQPSATDQHQNSEEQNLFIPPESRDRKDNLHNELQQPAMTLNENYLDIKKGLHEFTLYAAEKSTGEAGFQKVASSSSANIEQKEVSTSVTSHYLKAHFAYIKDLVHKNLIYPSKAIKMGWEGKVITSFIVSSDGYAKDLKISKSSGHEILDENAIKAIRNASPFPKPPIEAQIIIPILYQLN